MMSFYIGMVTDNYLECTAIPRGPYIKGILLFDHHAGVFAPGEMLQQRDKLVHSGRSYQCDCATCNCRRIKTTF